MKPVLTIIDGSYRLKSNKASLVRYATDGKIYKGLLVKSFMQSVFKQNLDMRAKGHNVTHTAIVWDRRLEGQYHKGHIIAELDDDKGEYKGDRTYVTKEDLDNPDLTEDERLNIEKELHNYSEELEARKFLMSELPKFGFPSFVKSGYEADDIAYVMGKENHKVGGYTILATADSDWGFQLQPNDIFWQVVRQKTYDKTVADVRKKYGIPEDIELMEWAEHIQSSRGNHNALKSCINPEIKRLQNKKLIYKLKEKDFSDLVDVDRYEKQRKCFYIEEFPEIEKVRSMYSLAIKNEITGTKQDFNNMWTDLKITTGQWGLVNNYEDYSNACRTAVMNQLGI